MNEEKYVNSKRATEIAGVSAKTLRVWDAENKIRTFRTLSGQRRYYIEDLTNNRGSNDPSVQKKKICYCRVSSAKQMDDLKRQEDFFREKFPDYELVSDVGSGINWKRKGLNSILEQALRGSVEEIVVAHRDRLCRFAFELLESIFNKKGIKLVVLDENSSESTESELAEDILSIVHIYSSRTMGKRRIDKSSKAKIETNSNSEEHL